MRYGVAGWYGCQNLGDELLLDCTLNYFGRQQAVVFTSNPGAAENVRRTHNVEAYMIKAIPEHDLDCLIFGGGGVFHDLTMEWHFPKPLVEKIHCPILMLSVGIPSGEGYSTLSKAVDYFVQKLSFVSFRGEHSRRVFSDLWGMRSYLLPDLAFLLGRRNAKRSGRVALQTRAVPKSYGVITPRRFNKIARAQFAELNSRFREQGLDPIFLIFNPQDKAVLPKNCDAVSCFDDVARAAEEISSAEALIGTRLHSSIIALTQGTPFKVYRYQGKIDEVIGMVCDSDRIIYPKAGLPFDRFYPIQELSTEEGENMSTIQAYLERSLDIVRKAIIGNDFSGIDLPEFPIPQSVSATHRFSKLGRKQRVLKGIRDWLLSKTRS